MAKRLASLMMRASLLAALATSVPGYSYGTGSRQRMAVVVSRSFSGDGISFGDLKRAYMGSAVIVGGKTLTPVTYARNTPERDEFDETVLGMSANEVGLYWVDRKIRGQSGPPKAVPNAATLLRVVGKVDGAIGFVREPVGAGKDVKVLRVDGKLPGDPGYRL